MAEEMKLTNEEAAALDQIDRVLKEGKSATSAEALSTTELCETYHSIRGALLIAVKILKKIPVIGEKAAAAVEFLMKLADAVCPLP